MFFSSIHLIVVFNSVFACLTSMNVIVSKFVFNSYNSRINYKTTVLNGLSGDQY